MLILDFWWKVQSSWRHPRRRESRFHFRFSVSNRARPIALKFSAIFGWKRALSVWWAMENWKTNIGSLFWDLVFEVWRAIPDVHGRQLRFAQLVEEEGCAPLLTTKYEPLPVGSDRVISAWTWRFSVFLDFFSKTPGYLFSNFVDC